MKTIKVILVLLLFGVSASSQNINIESIYNQSNNSCIKEQHRINISDNIYTRIDTYDNSKIWKPSKKTSSGYDDQNIYYEVLSPKFYLDLYGIDEYRKVYQYLIKIFYQKRGGEILYIIEQNMENKSDPPKFLLTKLGAKYFCQSKN